MEGLLISDKMMYIIAAIWMILYSTVWFLVCCILDILRYIGLILWHFKLPDYKYYYLGKKRQLFTPWGIEYIEVATNTFGYWDIEGFMED